MIARMPWARSGGGSGRPLALFVLGHVLLFGVVFQTIYRIHFGGTGLFFGYANQILTGKLPYRDFMLEYPPLALPFFLVPRLAGASFGAYHAAFQIQVLLADLLMLGILQRIASRSADDSTRVLGSYSLGVLAVGPIITEQYDIFPAMLTLVALYAFEVGRRGAAWTALAAGVWTKIYPLLLAPVFAAADLRARATRELRVAAVAIGAVSVRVLAPWLVSPRSLLVLVHYHGDRGIQIESTYSSLLLLASRLNLLLIVTRFGFGSWNVAGSGVAVAARISTAVLFLFVAAAYWWTLRTLPSPPRPDVHRIASAALLVLVAGLLGSKVLSPQYLIWLLPFLPLSAPAWRGRIVALFVTIGALTYFVVPLHTLELASQQTAPIAALLLRNCLLAVLAITVALSMRAPSTQAVTERHP